jgi:hypothetical protein
MDSSPKGREIEELCGDGAAISKRGYKIEALGQQMIDSASKLESIADGASGQKGLAVEKLKEVIADSYKELKLAGEHYKPNGKPLYTYGAAVSELQPKIKAIVSDLHDDWHTYTTRSAAVPTAIPSGTEPSDDGSAKEKAEKEQKEAQGLADSAYAAWKEDAETFDGYYDTWEEAFNKAVNDINDATKGDIKDSFWDDLDGFVAAALTVLKWVGLALALACIIIGGPILAAIAAVVALATLALTIYSYCRGNSTLTDLIFAVVGVIPFGSLGKLATAGKRLEFLQDIAGGIGKGEILGQGRGILSAARGAFTTGGGGASGLLAAFKSGGSNFLHFDGLGAGNIISRLFTGKSMAGLEEAGADGTASTALNILGGTWGDGFTKTIFGIPDTLFDFHNKIGATSAA